MQVYDSHELNHQYLSRHAGKRLQIDMKSVLRYIYHSLALITVHNIVGVERIELSILSDKTNFNIQQLLLEI